MKDNHLAIADLPFAETVRQWLKERYGEKQAEEIWKKTCRRYDAWLTELPDYGGKKNQHASGIYGGLLVFALVPVLPDYPPIEELQDFVSRLFMGGFTKLGKIFNLNRNFDMWLIDKVFRISGNKDRAQSILYPASFVNVDEPYDKENHAARYHFTQCPHAKFAKAHDLVWVLPLLCNSDFFGIGELHGQLIRESTCGNGALCDYCIVGNRNPLAKEYETVKDVNGFLVSRKR